MSQAPADVDPDELHLKARKVLLDALAALAGHRDAITVVGAQAVYLHTERSTIRSASHTSDGDISIDPAVLGDQPLLQEAMEAAGFSLKIDASENRQVGLWERGEQINGKMVGVEVDLLVPEALAPGNKKKRRTELPPHDAWATKKVPGLEAAVVDRQLMTISSLMPEDDRQVEAYVAGPAALLIAKAFKIHERVEEADKRPGRLSAKDAGDVYRLMSSVPVTRVMPSFAMLSNDPRVGEVTQQGIELLYKLFGAASTPGTELAVQALAGDVPEARVRALVSAYAAKLRS